MESELHEKMQTKRVGKPSEMSRNLPIGIREKKTTTTTIHTNIRGNLFGARHEENLEHLALLNYLANHL